MPRQVALLSRIAEAVAAEGWPVDEEPGWETRGSRDFDPQGQVNHHDASPEGSSARRTIRDGRAGLPGPLGNLYLEEPNVLVVIAAGRANHAGRGGWKHLRGNRTVLGYEIDNNGRGEPYGSLYQLAVAVNRAAADQLGPRAVELTCAHFEWTRRKIDPSVEPSTGSGEWDMDRFRALVAGHDPNRSGGDDDMIHRDQEGPEVEQLQHTLNRLIYVTGGSLDGGGQAHDKNGSHLKVDGVYGGRSQTFCRHAILRAEKWILDHPIYGSSDPVSPLTEAWLVEAIGRRMAKAA